MTISVAYHGQLRLAAGTDAEDLSVPDGCSAWDVLTHVARRHAALRTILFTPDGQASRALLLAVRDQQVQPGQRVLLRDGDAVTLLPPIGGG